MGFLQSMPTALHEQAWFKVPQEISVWTDILLKMTETQETFSVLWNTQWERDTLDLNQENPRVHVVSQSQVVYFHSLTQLKVSPISSEILGDNQLFLKFVFLLMLAWPLVFCFISVPEWQNGSLLQEITHKRTSCFYGSLKREVGFKKKRKNKIWINIFQLVSRSRKHVQTLFHRFLAVEIPPGWTHSSS